MDDLMHNTHIRVYQQHIKHMRDWQRQQGANKGVYSDAV